MRNVFKSQKGYALVIVLLIITIIAIMVPPLIGSVMSSAKQNNKTEEDIQLAEITDMGIIYFRNFIRKVEDDNRTQLRTELNNVVRMTEQKYASDKNLNDKIETAKLTSKQDYVKNIADELNRFLILNSITSLTYFDAIQLTMLPTLGEGNYQYKIHPISVVPKNNSSSVVDLDNYYIDVDYKSIPFKHSNMYASKEKRETLTINFGDIDSTIGTTKRESCSNPISGPITESSNYSIGGQSWSECVMVNGDLKIEESLIIIGHNKNDYSKLIVNNGNLTVKGTFDPKFANIFVYGDAYLHDVIHSENAHFTIDIYGNVYVSGKIAPAALSNVNVHNGGKIIYTNWKSNIQH